MNPTLNQTGASGTSNTLRVRRGDGQTPQRTAGISAATPVAVRPQPVGGTADRALHSDALLSGHSHISIVHNGETYQLRATRLGKLILTK